MRRIVIAVLAALGFAAVGAPAAGANGGGGGPVSEPVPDVNVTLRGYCDFPVHLGQVVNHEIQTTYPDGHLVIRGKWVASLKNLRTDKRIVVDASGPVFFYPRSNGRALIILKGRSLVSLLASETGLGRPILWLTRGTVRITADAQGRNHLQSFPDTRSNLCTRLA